MGLAEKSWSVSAAECPSMHAWTPRLQTLPEAQLTLAQRLCLFLYL